MARTSSTFLMFNGVAEKAMNLYVSMFRGSEINRIELYGPGEDGTEGSVKGADFELSSHRLICFDSLMPLDNYGFSKRFGWTMRVLEFHGNLE